MVVRSIFWFALPRSRKLQHSLHDTLAQSSALSSLERIADLAVGGWTGWSFKVLEELQRVETGALVDGTRDAKLRSLVPAPRWTGTRLR
jgi:hypothetical protein